MNGGAEPELFETFDDCDQPLGLMPRAQVHRQGIWHRAVNVFLFDDHGQLYIQRRSSHKDVGAGLWDLSAAEHLQPGESFEEGARRGLMEELGAAGVVLTAYPGTFRHKLEQAGVRDWEIQRCYYGHYAGPIRIDPDEVAEVRSIGRAALAAALAEDPDSYTPWFRQRVSDVDLLTSGWHG
jgi:isopentenyldiphosphate isomerase